MYHLVPHECFFKDLRIDLTVSTAWIEYISRNKKPDDKENEDPFDGVQQ